MNSNTETMNNTQDNTQDNTTRKTMTYCFNSKIHVSVVNYLTKLFTWDMFVDPYLNNGVTNCELLNHPRMLIFRHHTSGDKIKFTVDSAGKVNYTMLNDSSVWESYTQELQELVQTHQVVDYQAKLVDEAKHKAFKPLIHKFADQLYDLQYPELPVDIEPLSKELLALMLETYESEEVKRNAYDDLRRERADDLFGIEYADLSSGVQNELLDWVREVVKAKL